MRATRGREWRALLAAALPFAASFVACARQPPPVDLVRAGDRLAEARAASLDKAGVVQALGRSVRINDVMRRTLPGGPPSRLVFRLDVPPGARFVFTCAVAPAFQDRPGVEFVVKVRKEG